VIGAGREKNDLSGLDPILRAGMRAVLRIRTMRQPVIAAVHGAAAGAGMNIALAAIFALPPKCHFRPEFCQGRIVSGLRRDVFLARTGGTGESG